MLSSQGLENWINAEQKANRTVGPCHESELHCNAVAGTRISETKTKLVSTTTAVIIVIFRPRYSIPREEKSCYAKTIYENKLEWSLLPSFFTKLSRSRIALKR